MQMNSNGIMNAAMKQSVNLTELINVTLKVITT